MATPSLRPDDPSLRRHVVLREAYSLYRAWDARDDGPPALSNLTAHGMVGPFAHAALASIDPSSQRVRLLDTGTRISEEAGSLQGRWLDEVVTDNGAATMQGFLVASLQADRIEITNGTLPLRHGPSLDFVGMVLPFRSLTPGQFIGALVFGFLSPREVTWVA